jgi:hypothetical protein
MMLAVSLCLAWSMQAYSFYTVHKVQQLEMYITFQAALGNTNTETLKENDILSELSAGRPDKKDVLAAVIDCNDPHLITLVVWNMVQEDIAAGSSMIPLDVIEYVTDRQKNRDRTIALLDAESLLGGGLITANVKFKEIKVNKIPPGADPGDETFCVSRLDGLSVAGYIDTIDGFGIVWGGRLAFGNAMTSITNFTFVGN